MLNSNTEKAMLRLNLQFFGAEGAGSGTGEGAAGADTATVADASTTTQTNDDDRIAKIVQSQVDRLMADERKKNADLQKKVDRMAKEKLSDDEIKKLEMQEKETELAEREKAINQQRNLIYAQQVVTKAGYGEDLESVVDFVMSDSEEKTDERIKAFKSLVDKIVATQVNNTFKANGRTPNGANNANVDDKKDNSIAERLGKARAAQAKQSNDVLQHYIGGNKR